MKGWIILSQILEFGLVNLFSYLPYTISIMPRLTPQQWGELVEHLKLKRLKSVHNHNLRPEEDMDLVLIRTGVIADSVQNIAYYHRFHMKYDIQATLGNTFPSELCVWESQARPPSELRRL